MKIKSIVLLVTIISAFIGLWIWTLLVPNNVILFGGSTSVNSLLQETTSEISSKTKNQYIYNSTGSQAGVVGAENGMYGAGFISKEISVETIEDNSRWETSFAQDIEIKNDNDIDQIKNVEKFYALQFAIDAIVIITHAPKWFENDSELNSKINFESKNSLPILKKAFESVANWGELANSLTSSVKYSDKKDEIITFTREDGSGTRTAFSDVTNIHNMNQSSIVNSNGMMFENVRLVPGSIGYISYGFIKTMSEDSVIRVAGFEGKKIANPIDNKGQDITNINPWEWDDENRDFIKSNKNNNNELISDKSFKLKRPFISIIKGNVKNRELVLLFFKNLFYLQNVFDKEGLVKDFKILSAKKIFSKGEF